MLVIDTSKKYEIDSCVKFLPFKIVDWIITLMSFHTTYETNLFLSQQNLWLP